MELHLKPHQNHVSPTKHKVIMHTMSHVIIQTTNQPIHNFRFMFNTTTYHPHLISCNIHGIIHLAFVVKRLIKQASNHIREPNRTRAQTFPRLAQARRPRLGERGSLAQASPSCLGESSNRRTMVSAISRLGETSSPERD